jgi:hypothetical protein
MGIEHEQELVLDHTTRIASLEQTVKDTSRRMGFIEKKLDNIQYLLILAIASVIVDIVGSHLQIMGL